MPTPKPGVVQQLFLYFCTGELKSASKNSEDPDQIA